MRDILPSEKNCWDFISENHNSCLLPAQALHSVRSCHVNIATLTAYKLLSAGLAFRSDHTCVFSYSFVNIKTMIF